MGDLTKPSSGREDVPAERAHDPQGPERPRRTVQQLAALRKAMREADVIRDIAFPAALASAVPLGDAAGPSGWKLYRDQLLKEAGNPTDPIERMMIEQLALAHFRVGRLHTRVAEARTVDEVKAFSAAATRLTGEFRRLALAIRQYRQPVQTKHFTVVRQQNVAENQQIAYLEGAQAENEVPSIWNDSEIASRSLPHVPANASPAQSEKSGSRPAEPEETRAADTRGA